MPTYALTFATSNALRNSTVTAGISLKPSYVASQSYWIATFITDSVIVICNVWIAVAFVSHSRNVLARHRIDEHNRRVYKSLMAAVTAPFARYLSTFALLVVMTNPSDKACEIAIDVGKSFFILSIVAIYIFYWTRQRSFYQNSALSHTVCGKVRAVSKFSLFQLLSMAFLMIPLAVYPNEYAAYDGGCIAKGGHVTKNGRYYVYAIFLLLAQVTVLALFSYPLVNHYRAQRRLKKESNLANTSTAMHLVAPKTQRSTPVISTEEMGIAAENILEQSAKVCEIQESDADKYAACQSAAEEGINIAQFVLRQDVDIPTATPGYNDEASFVTPTLRIGHSVRKLPATLMKRFSSMLNGDKLYVIIKRTFKLSALAVFSDMVTLFVAGDVLPEGTPQCVVRVVYDVDLFINVIAVIAGFEDWRAILKTPADRFIHSSPG